MTESYQLNVDQIRAIQQENKFAIPVNSSAGYVPLELPSPILTTSDLDVLNDPSRFAEFLISSKPTLVVQAGSIANHDQMGLDDEARVSVYTFLAPKRLLMGVEHEVERKRFKFFSKIFKNKLGANLEPGVSQFDEDTLDSADVFGGSVGIGLFIISPNGSPHCIGAADIKYPAIRPFKYDEGGRKVLETKRTRSFLEEARKFVDMQGYPILLYDYSGQVEFELHEIARGGFEQVTPTSIVDVGKLPLDTLLKEEVKSRALVEIGQFAGNGFGVVLAASFIKLFQKATFEVPDLIAGFTLSPFLLKLINLINRYGSTPLLSALNIVDYLDFENAQKMEKYIFSFSKGLNAFSVDEYKKTRITFVDGTSIVLLGGFQADSFEIPFKYSLISLTHLFH